MKIVVIGAGKVGSALAKGLSHENHDIVIIDRNADVVENLVNELDILGVVGDGSLAAEQREADVHHADLVIAVTVSDQTNLLCCLVAKALGAKYTIARVREPAYSEQAEFMRASLGIDLLVNPDNESAQEIARHLRYPNAENVDTFGRGRADLVGVRVEEGNPMAGLTLREFAERSKIKVLVCVIAREGEIVIPDGNTVVKPGDVVYFTGSYRSVDALFRKLDLDVVKIHSMIIIGGGRVTRYLARLLIESGMKVKIIESNRRKCEILAAELPAATVICGDGANQKLLDEEGIDRVDSFVTLTGNDELNILLSLYAKTHGVTKVITKVNGASFAELMGTLELGTVVSPKSVVSEQIIKYTRAMQAPVGGGVRALYKIADEHAEAVEFAVEGDPAFAGKPLRDLRLKPNVIIACILRGRELIIPDGSTTVETNDSLIVISADYRFAKLEEILL